MAGYSLPVQCVKTANTCTHISVRESLPWCPTQSGLGAMGSGAGGPPYFGLYLPPPPPLPLSLARSPTKGSTPVCREPLWRRSCFVVFFLFWGGGGGGGTLTVW